MISKSLYTSRGRYRFLAEPRLRTMHLTRSDHASEAHDAADCRGRVAIHQSHCSPHPHRRPDHRWDHHCPQLPGASDSRRCCRHVHFQGLAQKGQERVAAAAEVVVVAAAAVWKVGVGHFPWRDGRIGNGGAGRRGGRNASRSARKGGFWHRRSVLDGGWRRGA